MFNEMDKITCLNIYRDKTFSTEILEYAQSKTKVATIRLPYIDPLIKRQFTSFTNKANDIFKDIVYNGEVFFSFDSLMQIIERMNEEKDTESKSILDGTILDAYEMFYKSCNDWDQIKRPWKQIMPDHFLYSEDQEFEKNIFSFNFINAGKWSELRFTVGHIFENDGKMNAFNMLFCMLDKKISENTRDCINNIVDSILPLWSGRDGIVYSYRILQEQIEKHAVKSAVSAIMARNLSHIHGSHIEPGVQNKMDTLRNGILKGMLYI
jgi:hypothetical protein